MRTASQLFATSAVLFFACAGIRLHAQSGDNGLTLQSGGSTIHVSFPIPPPAPLKPVIQIWITKAATAVTNYYRRYPVSAVNITVNLRNRLGVNDGHASGWNGARIEIAVGRNNSAALFDDDWIMTHEMVHLAFPSVAEKHHWIEEGLATYIEPVARARVGQLSPEKSWGDMVDGMPNGLPEGGDHGLDHTPTWGRTYWGGAMFCLIADVKIHERTQNRKGLRDALRAIVANGGTISEDWEIEKALAIGDKATGTSVLLELYREMRDKPSPVDLDQLWSKLGLALRRGEVTFDDKASGAGIRRAITSPQS